VGLSVPRRSSIFCTFADPLALTKSISGRSDFDMHRAQHRAQGRASQLVLKSLIGSVGLAAGCSDNGGERLALVNERAVITEADAARLPFYCDGPVERAPQLILANIDDVAIPYRCNSASGASFTKLVDDRGDLVDFDQLRMRDALAFRDLHNRMAPELEAKAIEASGKLKVGVWFAVPEDVSRSASEIVLLSEAERSNERAVVEKRIGALAAQLASRLEAAVPGISVASYSPGLKGQAPYLAVEALPDELRAIGLLDGVVELTLNIPPEDEKAESEAWYDLDRIQDLIDNGEYVGAGVTIVDILGENGVWDSYNLGLKPGNCQPAVGGPFYTCYCPPASPNSPGSQSHLQDVLGIIKNNHPGGLRGGAATGATTIVGNVSTAYCATASIADAVDWAIINQGASVVNRSASMGTQSSRYLDWASSTNPWP